jgi:hypothetical protein
MKPSGTTCATAVASEPGERWVQRAGRSAPAGGHGQPSPGSGNEEHSSCASRRLERRARSHVGAPSSWWSRTRPGTWTRRRPPAPRAYARPHVRPRHHGAQPPHAAPRCCRKLRPSSQRSWTPPTAPVPQARPQPRAGRRRSGGRRSPRARPNERSSWWTPCAVLGGSVAGATGPGERERVKFCNRKAREPHRESSARVVWCRHHGACFPTLARAQQGRRVGKWGTLARSSACEAWARCGCASAVTPALGVANHASLRRLHARLGGGARPAGCSWSPPGVLASALPPVPRRASQCTALSAAGWHAAPVCAAPRQPGSHAGAMRCGTAGNPGPTTLAQCL